MKNFGEFYNDQVGHASCIILSHTGNAGEKKIADAVALLSEKNPTATIVTTDWTVLTGAQIVSVMDGKRDLVAELLAEARAANEAHAGEDGHHHHHHHDGEEEHECCHHHHDEDEEHECCHHHHDEDEGHGCCHHHHDEDEGHECHHHDEDEEHECHHHDEDEEHECCHHHHHEHHYDEHGVCSCGHHHHDHDADEVFTSWGRETAHKYSRDALEQALAALDGGEYGMILRAKGIVDGGADGWLEFDMVPGEHEVRASTPDVTGKLCVIGSELKEQALAELFHV